MIDQRWPTQPRPERPRPAKVAQTNHQTYRSSLGESLQKSSVVSSSHGNNEKHPRVAVQDNRETVTTSTSSPIPPLPRALTPSLVMPRDPESSLPPHDVRPLPSFGDVFASHDPRLQETFPLSHPVPGPASGSEVKPGQHRALPGQPPSLAAGRVAPAPTLSQREAEDALAPSSQRSRVVSAPQPQPPQSPHHPGRRRARSVVRHRRNSRSNSRPATPGEIDGKGAMNP